MFSKAHTIYTAGRGIHPVHSIFGAGYVPEHHVDHDQRMLPTIERETQFGEFVKALRMLTGGEPATAR